MQEESIFTKIIRGEIPAHKIYEDSRTLAILDINPLSDGHTLVIPKVQVDKIYDLPDDDFANLWLVAKKIAKHYDEILGCRIGFVVEGLDVAHAHIHVVPLEDSDVLKLHHGHPVHTTEEDFAKIEEKLKF